MGGGAGPCRLPDAAMCGAVGRPCLSRRSPDGPTPRFAKRPSSPDFWVFPLRCRRRVVRGGPAYWSLSCGADGQRAAWSLVIREARSVSPARPDPPDRGFSGLGGDPTKVWRSGAINQPPRPPDPSSGFLSCPPGSGSVLGRETQFPFSPLSSFLPSYLTYLVMQVLIMAS